MSREAERRHAAEVLAWLARAHGQAAFRDHGTTRALLGDTLGSEAGRLRPETELLAGAVYVDAPGRLLRGEPPSDAAGALTAAGVHPADAQWAVAAWAVALGLSAPGYAELIPGPPPAARPAGRRARTVAIVAAACLVLAAGTAVGVAFALDDDPAVAQSEDGARTAAGGGSDPDAQTDGTPPLAPEPDRVLRIGTLLPQTGSLSVLGPAAAAGAALAAAEINAAGGAFGADVEILEADSGDLSSSIGASSVERLLAEEVDAIVGPSSSAVALDLIDQISAADVLQVGPSTTSVELSDYPDRGLYFRMAPTDAFQGEVLGAAAAADGARTLALLVMDGAGYGVGIAERAAEAFRGAGGSVVAEVAYDPEASSFSAPVAEVLAAAPDAIAVIGFVSDSAEILAELAAGGVLPLSASGPRIYLVDGNMSADYDLPAGTLTGVRGTIPGAIPSADLTRRLGEIDPALSDLSYAAEAFDAVTLIALAAEAAGADAGPAMAAQLQSVSADGTPCTGFAQCADLLRSGADIDYDGESGPIEFDDEGNPGVATMGIYEYADDGTFSLLRSVTAPVVRSSVG